MSSLRRVARRITLATTLAAALLSLDLHSQSPAAARPRSVTIPPVETEGEPEQLLNVERAERGLRFLGAPLAAAQQMSLAISPNGRVLAAAGDDGIVRLWDPKLGRELRRLRGHSATVSSVAFSPDGLRLLSGGADSAVILWDVETGREVLRLAGHTREISSVAFASTGAVVAAGSKDGTIRLWNAGTGNLTGRLEGHLSAVTAIAFTSDGKQLGSSSTDRNVVIWEWESGKEVGRLETAQSSTAIAFSPRGNRVAFGTNDGNLWLWDAPRIGSFTRKIAEYPGGITALSYDRDDNWIASAGVDGVVYVRSLAPPGEVARLSHNWGRASDVSFAVDGRSLATSGADGTIRIWDLVTASELRTLSGTVTAVHSLRFDDDRTLSSTSSEGFGHVWDVASGRELSRQEGNFRQDIIPRSAVNEFAARGIIATSLDGRRAASVAGTTLIVSDARASWRSKALTISEGVIYLAAFSPNAELLAWGGSDGSIRIWDFLHSNEPLRVLWAGRDGWVAWRRNIPPSRRTLRGETGSLLLREAASGVIERNQPTLQDRPALSVKVERLVASGESQFGKVEVAITNAPNAGTAYWVELHPVEASSGGASFHPPRSTSSARPVLRAPAPIVRIDPGTTVTTLLEYSQFALENPAPMRATVQVALGYSGIDAEQLIPIDLSFHSADLAMTAESPIRDGDDVVVPITVTNVGDERTGRKLRIGAEFLADDDLSVHHTDLSVVAEDGLASGERKQFSLPVPNELRQAKRLRVRMIAREGIAPGKPNSLGLVRQWVRDSEELRPRVFWALYSAIMAAAIAAAAAVHYVRVYRNPIVLAVARDDRALLALPLESLPTADRALQRARRLSEVLAKLGISVERWQRVLDVARSPATSAHHFAEVLGAELLALTGLDAFRATLPQLRLRIGPRVALAVVNGARLDPIEAARLANGSREQGLSVALILDRTRNQQAVAAFTNVAQFTAVSISEATLRDILLREVPLRELEFAIARQLPRREISPFRVAGGVEEASVFFGREDELRTFADRSLHNAILVGARQMGKSSLLKAVARRFATRDDVEVFYRVLATGDLMTEMADALGHEAPQTAAQFQTMVRGTRDRPRLWLIDEADRFAELEMEKSGTDRGVAWAMRALAEEGTTYFVLAGFWGLFRAAVFRTSSPFRNLGELVRLGPLDVEAACRLIREPMASLDIEVDDEAINGILEETGRRANLIVLACQGLLELIGRDQRSVENADVHRVWELHAPLRDALSYWRAEVLDRAVLHAALSLEFRSRVAIESRLQGAGITPTPRDLDVSFERLELGYVLIREPHADGGVDVWRCPVPLIQRFERRIMDWDEHLARDAASFAASDPPSLASAVSS